MLRSPIGLRNFKLMLFPPGYTAPAISDVDLHWQPLEQHRNVPAPLVRKWLTDTGSLTKLLVTLSNNHFQVQLVSEDWVIPTSATLIQHFGPIAPMHRFWSRKVLLLGKGEPWVAAHTLIPEHSFCSPLQQVMELNTKPLGEFLFSHPELVRGEMDFATIATQGWARRSLFFLYQKPIMVAEFFLPALLARIAID